MTGATLHDGLVFTYHPDGRAVGLVTGYPDEHGGLIVEHVVCFPEAPLGTLGQMLRAALAVGRERAWRHIVIRVDRHPLMVLARRLGFCPYHDDFWVLYL